MHYYRTFTGISRGFLTHIFVLHGISVRDSTILHIITQITRTIAQILRRFSFYLHIMCKFPNSIRINTQITAFLHENHHILHIFDHTMHISFVHLS